MERSYNVQWLMLLVATIIVAVVFEAAPKWGALLLVILVFAMLGRGIERGHVQVRG